MKSRYKYDVVKIRKKSKSRKNLKSTEVKIYSLKASQPQTTEDPFFDFGFDEDTGAFEDDDVWDWDDEEVCIV